MVMASSIKINLKQDSLVEHPVSIELKNELVICSFEYPRSQNCEVKLPFFRDWQPLG
jgi:hypothetical protein